MIYVKANVERIVGDLSEAKKLEAEGFRRIEPRKPKESPVEPKEEKRLVDLIQDKKPEDEAPAKPKRRRRAKAE